MYGKIKDYLQQQIKEIKDAGLYKNERLIESPQGAEIQVGGKTGSQLLCKQLLRSVG
jgi:glycine C-acetyltransferase